MRRILNRISHDQNAAEEQLCIYAKVLTRLGVSREEILRQVDIAIEEYHNQMATIKNRRLVEC